MDFSKKKILLVEDDPMIAKMETRQLEKKGYSISHAKDAKTAIEMIFSEDCRIDLILMDIDLGTGMDGTEAAEEILKKKDIPIVFLSSHTEPEIVEKTEKITSYGYVVKDTGIVVLDTSIKMAFKLFNAKKEEEKKSIELNESEKKYRNLFEEHSAVKLLIDPEDGKIVDANKQALLFYGYTKKEILTKKFHDLNYLSSEKAKVQLDTILNSPKILFEFQQILSDGSIKEIIFFSTTVQIQSKAHLHCIIVDITDYVNEKKKYIEDLRKSEAFNKLVMDSLPIGIAVNTVLPEVQFLYMNQKFSQFYRTKQEVIQGSGKFWEAVYEDEEFRKSIQQRVLSDITSGDVNKMAWEDIPIKRGEETFYISAYNTPLPENNLMISTVLDVTHQNRLKQEAEIWKNSLEYILKYDPIGIAVLDKKMNFVFVSDQFKKLYHLENQNIIGENYFTTISDQQDKWKNYFERVLQGEILPEENEPSLQDRIGNEYVKWNCRPWYKPNRTIDGIILYLNRITDVKIISNSFEENKPIF
jgi:PAS domain S-box-containing protein